MKLKELLKKDMGAVVKWMINNQNNFELKPLTTEKEAVTDVLCNDGFYSLLRKLKEEVKEHIRSQELDDGDELCLDSQELIVGWIENFFEDKIYDIENGL